MRSIAALLVVCLLVPSLALPKAPRENECRETIVATGESVAIEYKADTTYDAHELCVWTIRFPDAEYIEFELEQSGLEGGFDVIGIATVDSSFGSAQTVINSFEITSYGVGQPVQLPGTIAIVTFDTDGSVQGTGFILHVSKNGTFETPMSPQSVDTIAIGDGSFEHPAAGNYANYEFSTFVIAPSSTTSSCTANCTEVSYTLAGLEGGCLDHLNVFDYNVVGRGIWSHRQQICNDVDTAEFSLGPLALLTFTTDGSVTSSGFTVEHSTTTITGAHEDAHRIKKLHLSPPFPK